MSCTQTGAWRGVAAILLASVLFGAMAVFVRLASAEMAPLQIAFVRFAGSLAVLVVATRGRELRPQAGNLLRLLQRGALGALSICLYYLGIGGAGAGLATLLHCTYPVWTVLFAGIFLAERARRNVIAALVVNLVGVAVVIGPGSGLDAAAIGGAMYALAASILAGAAVATARHLRATENASLITTYFMAVGAVVTTPALFSGLPPLTWTLTAAVLGVVLTSVAGQWLLHHGLGFTTAATGSLTAATSVVTAAVLESMILESWPPPHTFLGAALMIVAIGLALRRG